MSDLFPFRTLQKIAALRSSHLLNYSELARDASLGIDRVRRYLEYLRISYQVFFLPPFAMNHTKRLVKSPKLYWLDLGIWRQLTGFREEMSGAAYETLIVSELLKWIQTTQIESNLFFYRTHDGAEIDLIIETPKGILGAEIKSRPSVVPKDYRHLRELANKLGKRWKGGIVIYNGDQLYKVSDPNIWAIPSWRLFT